MNSGPPSASPNLSPAPAGHICVSTTFYPGAPLKPEWSQSTPPTTDVVLFASRDQVYFYVHSKQLLERSVNEFAFLLSSPTDEYAFAPSSGYGMKSTNTDNMTLADSLMEASDDMTGLLQTGLPTTSSRSQFLQSPPPSQDSLSGRSEASGSPRASPFSAPSPPKARQTPDFQTPKFIALNETAEMINLLLHCVYNISAEPYFPSFELLSRLPAVLTHYGYPPEMFIDERSLITRLFLSHAKENLSLEVYALAAAYELEYLAQGASKAALAFPLTALSDSQIVQMGR